MYILNNKEVDREQFFKGIESAQIEYDRAIEASLLEESKLIYNNVRIQELQDKAVLEGLTDKEKEEYKELRGL